MSTQQGWSLLGELRDRVLFLLGVAATVVLDGLWLLGCYLWAHWIDTKLKGFAVEGWESWLLLWVRIALALAPIVVVSAYVVRDVVGGVKRMWQR